MTVRYHVPILSLHSDPVVFTMQPVGGVLDSPLPFISKLVLERLNLSAGEQLKTYVRTNELRKRFDEDEKMLSISA